MPNGNQDEIARLENRIARLEAQRNHMMQHGYVPWTPEDQTTLERIEDEPYVGGCKNAVDWLVVKLKERIP